MNDQQLNRYLQSVGKGCFVKYLELFENERYSNEDLIEKLMAEEGYTEKGSRTRVVGSRRIIEAGRRSDALEMIAESKRLDPKVVEKAKQLLG